MSSIPGVNPNQFGMAESIVCSRASDFAGTFYSTFTGTYTCSITSISTYSAVQNNIMFTEQYNKYSIILIYLSALLIFILVLNSWFDTFYCQPFFFSCCLSSILFLFQVIFIVCVVIMVWESTRTITRQVITLASYINDLFCSCMSSSLLV